MTEPVFPIAELPGLTYSVEKIPTFQTRVQRAVSGRELRALDYPYPLWQLNMVFELLRDYVVADGVYNINELRTLMGFYLQAQGAFGTFLVDDPDDDSVTGQPIGTGDGTTTVFQLARTLGGFYEPMHAPNVVSAIKDNGSTVNPANYSVTASNGAVTFTSAPLAGHAITADFTYYFRCRFVDDSLTFEKFMDRLWTVKKLSLISVIP